MLVDFRKISVHIKKTDGYLKRKNDFVDVYNQLIK